MRLLVTLILLLGSMRAQSPAPPVESTIYSPIGKRDPFRPPSKSALSREVASTDPLERFALEQLQLRAILRDKKVNRAMFEDPDGKTHIVTEGAVIGRERAAVSRILNSEVILTEKTVNYLGQESLTERIVSLESEGEAK